MPIQLIRHERGHLRQGEYEHQVKEELQRRNRGLGLLFAHEWMGYLHVHILLPSADSLDR